MIVRDLIYQALYNCEAGYMAPHQRAAEAEHRTNEVMKALAGLYEDKEDPV